MHFDKDEMDVHINMDFTTSHLQKIVEIVSLEFPN
jgi:hypothetical protein